MLLQGTALARTLLLLSVGLFGASIELNHLALDWMHNKELYLLQCPYCKPEGPLSEIEREAGGSMLGAIRGLPLL